MKIIIINKFIYLNLFIVILLAFSQASVRVDIKDINSVNALQTYYEDNSSNLYNVRYIIKYLPDFLENLGISTCPGWVVSLAENSLYSTYAPLITESIRIIGKYELPGNTDKLYDLFTIASKDYANSSTEMRFAIVRTLSQIGEDYEKIKLVELFNSYPKELIGLREFRFLAEKVASLDYIPAGGERVIVLKITEYLNNTDNELSKYDPLNFEDEAEFKYFSNLKYILEKINNNTSLLENGGD